MTCDGNLNAISFKFAKDKDFTKVTSSVEGSVTGWAQEKASDPFKFNADESFVFDAACTRP